MVPLTAVWAATFVLVVLSPGSVIAAKLDAPGPSLRISTDGVCGDGTTCLGSDWGICCSAHGFCGNSNAYCGQGCLPAYGACGEGIDEEPTTLESCPKPTTNVTRTTTVTATFWEAATETRLPSGWTESTREVTMVVPSTSLVLVTSTRMINRIQTLTASLTINVTVTSTSTNIVRETTTSTRLFRTTSVVVETSTNLINKTNIIVSTFIATLGTCSAPSSPSPTRRTSTEDEAPTSLHTSSTGTPRRDQPSTSRTSRFPGASTTATRVYTGATRTVTTTTTAFGASSSNTLPGINVECKRFYTTVDGDTCQSVSRRQSITQNQLLSWNPSLIVARSSLGRGSQQLCEWEDITALRAGRCKLDCTDLWPSYRLCVGI